LAASLSLAFLGGCAVPGGPLTGSSSPQTLEGAVRATLQNLPELKVTLPASLSQSSESGARSAARSVGDVEVLDSVPSLKSEAWYQLQSSNGFQGFINKAFGFLREYAKANDVSANQEFTVPVTSADLLNLFAMPASMAQGMKVNARMLVTGSDRDHFTIWAFIDGSIEDSEGQPAPVTFVVKSRMDVESVSGGKLLDFYMNVKTQMGGEEAVMPFYAHYNTATGACDMVQKYESPDHQDPAVIHTYEGIQRSTVGPGGSITSVNLSRFDGEAQGLRVAYGDDVAGGIASLSPGTYNGLPASFLTGEYYGRNGHLLKVVDGSTNLWVPAWDEGVPVFNVRTLGYTQAPDLLQRRSFWDGTTGYTQTEVRSSSGTWVPVYRTRWVDSGRESQYSDDGVSWTDTSGYAWQRSLVFQAGNDPAQWSGGDAVYYWKASRWESTGGVSATIDDLYQGYVVPAPVHRFGRDFFTTDEYPLDTLLPLQGTFAQDYQLIRQEGNTDTWTWTDQDGKERSNSWTAYSFYLNFHQAEGAPIQYSRDEGDINLDNSLSSHDMYYWHDGTETKVKGYFLRTTAAVPEYFTQPDASLVHRVDGQLTQAIEAAYSLDISVYADQMKVALGDPTEGRLDR